MDKFHKIADVAKIFNIPVSTLHYWEQQGLFEVERNQQNKYREYTVSDILNIWEILLYRDMEIPLKNIREIQQNDLDSLERIYDENEAKLNLEIQKLQRTLQRLKRQKKLIEKLHELGDEIRFCRPDFTMCRKDSMNVDSMRITLQNSYRCCLLIDESGNITRGITQHKEDHLKTEILWEEKEEKNLGYAEFLLKVKVEDLSDNNLEDIRSRLQEMGYQTGGVIARYLLIAGEKNVRFEYYRAWIEIRTNDFNGRDRKIESQVLQ